MDSDKAAKVLEHGWVVLPTIQWPRTIQSAAVLSILTKLTGLKSRVNVEVACYSFPTGAIRKIQQIESAADRLVAK